MALDKKSYQSDAVANLYRAALYLARGSEQIGLDFYNKAKSILGNEIKIGIDPKKGKIYLAEKILDEYLRLR